jgi:hypothetical protein
LSFSQNWNEVIREGWEQNLVIEKPSNVEFTLARISFLNIPCNWEFLDFVGNDKRFFMGCEKQKYLFMMGLFAMDEC